MSTFCWLFLLSLTAPAGNGTIEIHASHFKLFPKKHEAVWTGHVKARRQNAQMTCLKLIAFYTPEQTIERIDCKGEAEVQDGDRWARGDQARFDSSTDQVTVTGSPQARQGPNSMSGTKVILQLGTHSMEVENAQVLYKHTARGVGQ